MQSLECKQCGLVYLSSVASCPRCGSKTPDESPSSSRPLLWTALWLLLVAGVGVAYYLWPARAPAYAQAIRTSAELKRLATVRVNKSALGMPGGSAFNYDPFKRESAAAAQKGVTRAAYVLAARGLVAFDVTLHEQRSKSTIGPSVWIDGNGRGHTGAEPPDIVTWSKTLGVRVTEMGRKDATSWEETEEPFDGATRGFWRVPVGEVELVRIGRVTADKTGDGRQRLTAEIVWRWRPNWVGQSFDQSGEVFKMLPEKARAAASGLGFDSRQELTAFADLESTADGWKVVDIHRFGLEMLNEVMSAD